VSTLRVNTIQDASGGDIVNSRGIAKAWVNFNGTGTVAIRAAHNVTSITDNATGQYTVNYTVAMPDANYVAVIYNNATSGTAQTNFDNQYAGGAGGRTTTSIGVCSYNNAGFSDSALFDVVIFD
jgi:hypothetical protein